MDYFYQQFVYFNEYHDIHHLHYIILILFILVNKIVLQKMMYLGNHSSLLLLLVILYMKDLLMELFLTFMIYVTDFNLLFKYLSFMILLLAEYIIK
jgi:hypothetical protein